MNLLLYLYFFLVFFPSAGFPQGVFGCLRPIPCFPSPPPCGWSTGFITDPRTVGLIPSHLERPALPIITVLCNVLLTWPIVAKQSPLAIRSSPDESLSWAIFPSTDIRVTEEPALLPSWAPLFGKSSTRQIWVPIGIFLSIALLPILTGVFSAVKIFWPSFIPETAT